MLAILGLFLMLLFWHALADYPLQGDFLSRAKRRDGVPGFPWYQALFWHSAIHAGGVVVITGSLWMGLVELVAHGMIDYGKCQQRFGINVDQALHVATKVVIILLLRVRFI
jgi:hypothetical protein